MTRDALGLRGRLRALSAQRSGLAVGLWGEPGIGKTHAAHELLRGAPCRTLGLHATLPLEALFASLPTPVRWPAWAQRTAERLRAGQEVSAEALQSSLAAHLAAITPFVLYLEDLHEAGPERLSLVQALAHAARRTGGLGLLVSSRTPPPAPLEAVKLERLSAPESRALLEAHVGAPLPVQAAEWIDRRAAGNPLFTVEYFRFLARQGALWNDGQLWHWRAPQGADTPLPTTVEALIELVLRGVALHRTPQDVLTARALLGPDLDANLWARVAGCDARTLQDARAQLARLGVLSGDEFVHPLYREVLLRHLPPPAVQVMALRALQEVQGEPRAVLELVGRANLPAGAALTWLLRAAATADRQGRRVEAARIRARASALAPPEQAAALALDAALVLRDVDVTEATRLAQRAAGYPAQAHEATWLLAETLAAQCRVSEAEEALRALPEEERRGPAWLTRLLMLRGSGQDHAGVLELLASPEVRAHLPPAAARTAAWTLAQAGRTAEADDLLADLEARSDARDPAARLQLRKAASLLAYARADFGRMEALEAEVLVLARQEGNLRLVDAALFNRALALEYLERYEERMACLEAALQVCLELGDQTAYVIAQTAYATTLCDFGQYGRAETLLLDARSALERTDDTVYRVDCEAQLSALYLAWRPAHGALLARRHAQTALQVARRLHSPRSVVQALHQAVASEVWDGDTAQALTLAAEAGALADEVNLPVTWMLARTARGRALAAAGQREAALAELRAGEAQAREVGASVTAHLVGLEIAALEGDGAGAARHRAYFASHGLQGGVQVAERLFPALRTPAPVSSAPVTLEVLGSMRLIRNGQVTPLRGQKRKHLLALLLEARLLGQDGCAGGALCEALFPGTDDMHATSALKALVFKVRDGLGADLISTTASGYALGRVTSDAEAFLDGGGTDLWRGPYLEDVPAAAQDGAQERLHEALLGRVRALLPAQSQEAARLGRLLLRADPLHPAALHLTCAALDALGHRTALTALYARATQDFAEVGEALPARWQDLPPP